MSALTPHHAALWFVELGGHDELSLPDAPYIGIVLPEDLMRRVTDAASIERRSVGGWALMKLGEAVENNSGALSAVDEESRPSPRSIVDKIRQAQAAQGCGTDPS